MHADYPVNGREDDPKLTVDSRKVIQNVLAEWKSDSWECGDELYCLIPMDILAWGLPACLPGLLMYLLNGRPLLAYAIICMRHVVAVVLLFELAQYFIHINSFLIWLSKWMLECHCCVCLICALYPFILSSRLNKAIRSVHCVPMSLTLILRWRAPSWPLKSPLATSHVHSVLAYNEFHAFSSLTVHQGTPLVLCALRAKCNM